VRLRIPGMPHWLGNVVGFAIVWLVVVVAAWWVAHLVRRHHRAMARNTIKAGRNGAAGAAGFTVRGVKAAHGWAGPRWQGRQRASAEDQDEDPQQEAGDMTSRGPLSSVVHHDHTYVQSGQCPECGGPGPGIPLVRGDRVIAVNGDGTRVAGNVISTSDDGAVAKFDDGSRRTLPRILPREPGSSPQGPRAGAKTAPPAPNGTPTKNGDQENMTTPNGTVPPRMRLPDEVKDGAPAEWKALADAVGEAEPATDEEYLDLLAGQIAGMGIYGEAIADLYETCVDSIRLDPVAMASLHDVADAAGDFVTAVAYARQKFAGHYQEVREFTGDGGVLPKDGDWITGEGDA
jgi:hypothetical protein